MKEHTAKLLDRAQDAIEAADILLTNEKVDIAAGRAYYAMFYTAEALLNEKGLPFNKHSGVHAAFGKHFAKTNLLDPKYHHWLMYSFDKRLIGDYGVEANLQMDVVVSMIHQAQEFLEAAKKISRRRIEGEAYPFGYISPLRTFPTIINFTLRRQPCPCRR